MDLTTEQFSRILDFSLEQELHLAAIIHDVDLSAGNLAMPHFHQGLEIKIIGRIKQDSQGKMEQWQTEKTIIIPAQVVHPSTPGTDMVSILIEKNRTTCVCMHKMLTRVLSPVTFTDLGVAAASAVNFLQTQLTDDRISPELERHVTIIVKSLLSSIMIALEDTQETRQQPVARAINYINRNYYRHNLSVDDIAAYIGVTPNYLVSLFVRETGISVRQYLIRARLEQAQALLETGRCLVKDAARLTGWNSAYYFSNSYRRHYGVAPSAITKNIR